MPSKHLSGCQKRKKRKRAEELTKSLAGSLYKYMPKLHVEEKQEHVKVGMEETGEQEHVEQQEEHFEKQEHVEQQEEHVDEQEHVEEHVEANINEDHVKHNPIDISDPRRWEGLNSDEIKVLVEKGPKRDAKIKFGPYNTKRRRFSTALYTRTLPNMEKCDREWLVYSKELDKMFCFCCKVFRIGIAKGNLDGEGYANWRQATERIKEHEVSSDHLTNMHKWMDMRKRLKLNKTIDKVQYEQFKKERDLPLSQGC